MFVQFRQFLLTLFRPTNRIALFIFVWDGENATSQAATETARAGTVLGIELGLQIGQSRLVGDEPKPALRRKANVWALTICE